MSVFCDPRWQFLTIHYYTLTRPVYEYPLNGQWIMLDMDDGYVLWTGIWKGNCYAVFHMFTSDIDRCF